MALNAQRAAEGKCGLVRWLRPDHQKARAGVVDMQAAAESGAQIDAPLVVEAGKTQKPSFPTSEVERTAAVFAALSRLGHVDSADGKSFALRRAA